MDNGSPVLYTWFSLMHTRIDLILCDKEEKELKAIAARIYDNMLALEETANYFNPRSELSEINAKAFDEAVAVSPSLFTMIWQCLDYNKMTLGYFDITVKSDHHTPDMPGTILLDIENSSIRYQQSGTRIDLSGYLKGYALEAVKRILDDFHIANALINIGNSSVFALGNHPHGDGWKISHSFPGDRTKEPICLRDQCLTTSGNDTTDRKHLISPYTGTYVEGVGGVSVLTKQATAGEALSTALAVAPLEQRSQILENFEATAYEL